MGTASDRAPAVDATISGAKDELVTLYAAARRFGVKDATIFKWARTGRLPVIEQPRGRRTVRLVRLVDLATLLEERRTRELALERAVDDYRAGRTTVELAVEIGCSPETIANYVRAAGAELRSGGPPRLHPDPEPRECRNPRCRRIFTPPYPSWDAGENDGKYCSVPCHNAGNWYSDRMLARYSGRVRQRWKGRRSGKLGGRPSARQLDPAYQAKAQEARDLRVSNPRLGERELSRRTGLSRRQIRAVLADPSVS